MVQPTSTTSDAVVLGLTSSKMSIIDLSVLSRWTIVPKLLGPTDPGCKSYTGTALTAYNNTIDDLIAQASQTTDQMEATDE